MGHNNEVEKPARESSYNRNGKSLSRERVIELKNAQTYIYTHSHIHRITLHVHWKGYYFKS